MQYGEDVFVATGYFIDAICGAAKLNEVSPQSEKNISLPRKILGYLTPDEVFVLEPKNYLLEQCEYITVKKLVKFAVAI